jgi:arylsulfatase A-like enzyme
VIRGPGIEAGSSLSGYITGNVDFAPTIADLAGVNPPTYVDGRSMVQLFSSEKPSPDKWRSGYLLEFYGYNTSKTIDTGSPPAPSYLGLRTRDYLYVEYGDGFVELYDLVNDPFEMENIAQTADKTLLSSLSQWLHALSKCSGSACTTIDNQVP